MITIEEFQHVQSKVLATEYDGSSKQAHLLIDNGWLDGCDKGFGRDNIGECLRGLVGDQLVFPSDMLVRFPDGFTAVMSGTVFDQKYEVTDTPATVIADKENPVTEPDLSSLPTGENPDAVNLENPDAAAKSAEADAAAEAAKAGDANSGDTSGASSDPANPESVVDTGTPAAAQGDTQPVEGDVTPQQQ